MTLKKFSKYIFLLSCLSVLVPACIKISPPGQPLSLTCEFRSNPMGIDVIRPRLSWIVNDNSRGAAQTAYQILVASSLTILDDNKGDIWDSGKTISEESSLINFAGKELKSEQVYFWKVRTWNNEDMMSPYSKPAKWHMGLLRKSDWGAEWIGNEATGKPPRSVMLRNEFEVKKKIKRATAFVTGLGNYLFHLNGQKVGKDLLTPGWTHYPKKIQYQTYDVTSLLKKGKNAAGAILGNMWWSSGLGWKGGNERYSEGPLRFLLSLHINYEDGSSEKIVSNKNWLVKNSPFVTNTIYHGVTYDARLEEKGWDMPGFAIGKWDSVAVIEQEKISLVAQQAPTIQVMEEVKPIKVTEVANGKFVFDFGINMVGWAAMKVNGDAGKQVTLRYAEILDDKGNIDQRNLRSAKATDKYILKGGGEETFEPMFTYHGFRYVEVTGFPGKPELENLIGKAIYSSVPQTGLFESSNELLNKIQANIVRGQRSNLHSVPTDCPQRDERLGWMGDAQIFAPTASYNMNMAGFFAKWEKDITDSQDAQGFVHDVNPVIVVKGPSKPGWGDAVVVVPWIMYNFYGDENIIKENYEGMSKWVDFMQSKADSNIYVWQASPTDTTDLGYGDWIAPVESPKRPIGAAYYFYCSKLMAEMSRIIGKDEEGQMYDSLCNEIQTAFQAKYFDEYAMVYEGNTQTANLLPVAFGLTPPQMRKRVMDNVAKDVEAKGFHPSTGFLGTSYLLPLLSEHGHHEIAYKTATQTTYPSWGYMIDKGATTMWELWNSDQEPPEQMNSRNHFALGCVGEWYFGYLAGIRPETFEPGFKSSIIAPIPVGDLKWVKSSLQTNYGELKSNWKLEDGKFVLDVVIPANTASKIRIPFLGKENPSVLEGTDYLYKKGKSDDSVVGIQINNIEKDYLELIVGAGKYKFTLLAE